MKNAKRFFTICALAAALTMGSAAGAGSVWTAWAGDDPKVSDEALAGSISKISDETQLGSIPKVSDKAQTDSTKETSAPALNKTTAILIKGQTLQLKLANVDGKVTWSSSDKTIATVSAAGKVTAKKKGTATITAKNGGKKYTCKITVETPKLNKTTLAIAEGKTYKLKLSGTTQTVKWSSSDRTVAKVGSTTGKVSAVGAGECTITAKIGKKKYSCHVEVTAETTEKKPGINQEETPEQSQKNPGADSGKETEENAETPMKNLEKDSETKDTDTGSNALTKQQVYAAIMAMQAEYPEGMAWTNENTYYWKGGIYSGGMGCAAFAFAMSDAAFGDLPARIHTDYTNIRTGDILRVDNDVHSVIVLEVSDTEVVVAEGNYNSSIHWGRKISRTELEGEGNYIMTRYPE